MPRSTLLLFLLFGTSLATLGFVGDMYPPGGSVTSLSLGSSVTVYVQVYKRGVTDSPGQGAGIQCFLQGNFSALDIAMAWNPFFTTNAANDEYMGVLNSTAFGLGHFFFTSYCQDLTDNTTSIQNAGPASLNISRAIASTTAQATSAVPTTAVPTTGVPTTAIPTTAVPTTGVPTTGVPIIPCSRMGIRSNCKDLVCGYFNNQVPSMDNIPVNTGPDALNVLPGNASLVLTYLMRGIYGSPFSNATSQEGTSLEIYVDAGPFAGRAVQLIISYDWTGDGVWDRSETFPFFATNPITDFERFATNVKGVTPYRAATIFGDPYSPFRNGKVRVEFWSAYSDPAGATPILIRTDSVTAGQLTSFTLPYVMNYWTEPMGCTYPNPTTAVPTTAIPTTGASSMSATVTVPSRSIAMPSDVASGSQRLLASIFALGLLLVALL